MKISQLSLLIFAGALLLAGESTYAEVVPEKVFESKWVNGSWVNVRSTPTPTGKVVTHLKINTPVMAAPAKDDFCEIRYEEAQRGFVACALLGGQVVKIDDVDRQYIQYGQNMAVNPSYSPARAFWIQPSLGRLQEAGDYFENTLLTSAQNELETNFGRNQDGILQERRLPVRFVVPEFEAMKAVLINGVIASSARTMNYGLWKDIKRAVAIGSVEDLLSVNPMHYRLQGAAYLTMLRQVELSPAKPSYFKDINEIVVADNNVETLSAKFKIPFAIKILNGASNQIDNEGTPYIYGAWDMGEVDAFLTKPVYKSSMTYRGEVATESIDVINQHRIARSDLGEAADCHVGFQLGWTPPQVAATLSMRGGNDDTLFNFYTKYPLVSKRATIIEEPAKKLGTEEAALNFSGHEIFRYSSTKYFDIDEDGGADFAVWEGYRIPSGDYSDEMSKHLLPEPNFRMIFANAGGQWYLTAVDEVIYMCGC
jgi:hypothetical protein